MSIPRIVIAGTHSGCGKTTVASGLMQALTDRGLKVQPFKVGPDFIDPTHHTAICGRQSRNLDPFMMGEEGVLATFSRASRGADLAVIEGVMGLYDGLEGTDQCSTAHVSKILEAPVLLVVDVKGMARSANALVKGYVRFDPATPISGIIYNRVGSPNHRRMIEASVEVRALGWVPKGRGESGQAHIADVAEHLDIDAIVGIASDASPLPGVECEQATSSTTRERSALRTPGSLTGCPGGKG